MRLSRALWSSLVVGTPLRGGSGLVPRSAASSTCELTAVRDVGPKEDQPSLRAQEARRVDHATVIASALSAASLLALFSLPAATQGWVGAIGAILVFGASSLPAKHPAAAEAGPLVFQLFVTLGNVAMNALLLLWLGVPLVWDGWGVAGAAVLTLTQCFAWPAIQRLGAAVGPGIWCGIGMGTSVLWGLVVFGETMSNPPLAAFALSGLVGGVGGVAASQAVATRRGAAEAAGGTGDAEEGGSTDAPAAKAGGASLATGVACAVATGLLDGSLMAPFSAFRRSGVAAAISPELVAMRYLGAFALGLPVVAFPPLLVALAARRGVASAAGRAATTPSDLGEALRRARAAALPGVCTGALWASGNILSVHATLRLGQAVGFPLTQVCVVVSALWGVLWFGELRDRRALGLFSAASAVVLASAAALKLAGSPG